METPAPLEKCNPPMVVVCYRDGARRITPQAVVFNGVWTAFK